MRKRTPYSKDLSRYPDALTAELAQRLFAKAGTYRAVVRLSVNAGDIPDDAIALPRGLP